MSNNWYLVSALTGGAAGALDALEGSTLVDGDRAIAVVDDRAAFYVLDADSAAAESSPNVISPDTNAGDKRWILKKSIPYSAWELITDDAPGYSSLLSNSTQSSVSGEYCRVLDSSGCVVFSGEDNMVANGWFSIILGGDYSEIWDGGEHLIGGGYDNKIFYDNNWDSVICGGHSNNLWGNASVICGGGYNKVLGAYTSIVGGFKALTYIDFQEAFSAGSFVGIGDAQKSEMVIKNSTTDDTETTLSASLKPIGNRTWQFNIFLVARQTAGTSGTVGDSAFWNITGGIKTTGGVNAQGTITFTDAPTAAETLTIGSDVFTFTDEDELLNSHDVRMEGQKPTSRMEQAIERSLPWCTVISSYVPGTVILTSLYTRSSDNSLTFTESATNTTMDGSGTFGGTTAGVDPTTALVGTPQGTGVPGANDRDVGAAAWSVAVTADNTDNFLDIAVTGEADKTIHWVAKVSLVEVG